MSPADKWSSAVVEASSGSGWSSVTPMATPRESFAAVESSQQIYAIGGNTTGKTPVQTVERYSPSSNAWQPVASLASPRRYLSAAVVGQTIYAVGGERVSGGAVVVGDVEAYDSLRDVWTARAPMPTPRRSFGLAAVNGILYAIGGELADGTRVATVEAYDPGGWSIDRTVETTAMSGSGVDTLHIYAYPNPGSGQAPIFLGVADVGVARPDLGAMYGSRYASSGYNLYIDPAAAGLTPGVYDIVVHSHSSVSGTFNNVALVRVTLQ